MAAGVSPRASAVETNLELQLVANRDPAGPDLGIDGLTREARHPVVMDPARFIPQRW